MCAALLALFVAAGCSPEPLTPAEFRALAARGTSSELTQAVKHGAKLGSTDERGFTPLAIAAFNGRAEAVKVLLDLGAEPERGPSDVRPLYLACGQGHADVVHILLERGAKAKAPQGDHQPLAVAATPEVIELLIQAGADVNLRSGDQGETPLHRAVSKSSVETVRALLAHRPALDSPNATGVTSLHLACRPTQSDLQAGGMDSARTVLRLLLEAGANPNALDLRRQTPLHYAARHAAWTAADLKLLIRAGANVELRDSAGRTPLQIAELSGFSENAERLAVLAGRPSEPSATDQPK